MADRAAARVRAHARPRRRGSPVAAVPAGPAPRRRAVWSLLVGATLIAVLFIGVYPTRAFLEQRGLLHEAGQQLDGLRAESADLEAHIAALNTDAEIERLARRDHNLVMPGEESYAILPAPPPPLVLPAVWPFNELAPRLR